MGFLYISSCCDKDSSEDGIIECIPEEEACSLIPTIFNLFAQKVETESRHTGASRLTHPHTKLAPSIRHILQENMIPCY
jgi:hypothetical protein